MKQPIQEFGTHTVEHSLQNKANQLTECTSSKFEEDRQKTLSTLSTPCPCLIVNLKQLSTLALVFAICSMKSVTLY